jgi:hypothetical protein
LPLDDETLGYRFERRSVRNIDEEVWPQNEDRNGAFFIQLILYPLRAVKCPYIQGILSAIS